MDYWTIKSGTLILQHFNANIGSEFGLMCIQEDEPIVKIEGIMINSCIRKAVKNSYPGADADLDHNHVVAKFKLSLKLVEKPKRC